MILILLALLLLLPVFWQTQFRCLGEPPEHPYFYRRGFFAHYCNDWDGLCISEFTPELSCCLERWRGWRGIVFPIVQRVNQWYWQRRIERIEKETTCEY